ncbi:class I SAM-dependent methyltransferase [Paenibacillus sp. FSL K6-3182]|uniref:class I SAM-dependent methyltransferase n=1 Tax=Paenibacillus sp. FSL K6-3182 TaxID=2921495 RepID=UPI0030CE8477
MKLNEVFEVNSNNYENLYEKEEAFLRYPADWVIRFHNMFLKNNIPSGGKVLDYGCGSGNNAAFFMQKGYSVNGVDVAPSFKNLVARNLQMNNIDESLINNFSLIKPDTTTLDFPDNHFDFILSNQVLYYLPTEQHLKSVCSELNRILKPGGYVFFTMMGPQNYYITHHLKKIHHERIYEISIDDKAHRLNGVKELIYTVKDEEDLCQLFDTFEPVTVGYFDQKMFDLYSNFHYIFVGKKK